MSMVSQNGSKKNARVMSVMKMKYHLARADTNTSKFMVSFLTLFFIFILYLYYSFCLEHVLRPELFWYLMMGEDGKHYDADGNFDAYKKDDFARLKQRCDQVANMDVFGSLSMGKPRVRDIPPHLNAPMRFLSFFFFHSHNLYSSVFFGAASKLQISQNLKVFMEEIKELICSDSFGKDDLEKSSSSIIGLLPFRNEVQIEKTSKHKNNN